MVTSAWFVPDGARLETRSRLSEALRLLCFGRTGAGSGNRTRTLSLEGSYDTISPYPLGRFRAYFKGIWPSSQVLVDVGIQSCWALSVSFYQPRLCCRVLRPASDLSSSGSGKEQSAKSVRTPGCLAKGKSCVRRHARMGRICVIFPDCFLDFG